MKKNSIYKKLCLMIICFICIFFNSLFAQTKFPQFHNPVVVSPRLAGLGVGYTTLEAGVDSLFTNPATFSVLNKRWSFGKIAGSMSADVFNSISILSANNKKEAFAENLFVNKKCDYKLNATGPLALALADKNFAVGIFNQTIIDSKIRYKTAEYLLMGEEIFITGGYGGNIFEKGSNIISLGIQMKGFFQAYSYALGMKKFSVIAESKKQFKNLPIVLSNGIGIDVGFLYKLDPYFSIGITCRDAYTAIFLTPYKNFNSFKTGKSSKTEYKYIYPNISAGIATIPISNDAWKTISTLSFYVDYRNILAPILKKRNPLFNLAVGSEIIFHKVLSFRLGMYELYPHFGCGLDFTYFQFDFAAYLKATNNEIWKDPSVGIDFALSFEY